MNANAASLLLAMTLLRHNPLDIHVCSLQMSMHSLSLSRVARLRSSSSSGHSPYRSLKRRRARRHLLTVSSSRYDSSTLSVVLRPHFVVVELSAVQSPFLCVAAAPERPDVHVAVGTIPAVFGESQATAEHGDADLHSVVAIETFALPEQHEL